MRQKIYKTSLNEESSKTKCAFGIGPPAWIKKEMNDSTIERQFVSTIISLLTSYKLNKFVPSFSIFMNWNFARILHLRGSRYFHLMPSLPIICIYLHAVTGGNKSICYIIYFWHIISALDNVCHIYAFQENVIKLDMIRNSEQLLIIHGLSTIPYRNHLVDQWDCNSCSVCHCPSARWMDYENLAWSLSKPPWVALAPHLGWRVFIPTRIAASWLDQVGIDSAMRTRSGWAMSALSKSLKLPSGMSASSADKLGKGSTISSPICMMVSVNWKHWMPPLFSWNTQGYQ